MFFVLLLCPRVGEIPDEISRTSDRKTKEFERQVDLLKEFSEKNAAVRVKEQLSVVMNSFQDFATFAKIDFKEAKAAK